MDSNNPALSLPSAVIMNPAAMQAAQEDTPQTPDNTPRNAEFDNKMREFAIAETSDIMNDKMSTADYMKRGMEREDAEYAALKEFEKDASLSENQRRELNARLQMLDYTRESRDIQDQYMENPNDPEIKAKYEARESELKDYRQLMQNSEEFKDSKSMEKMRELEDKLDAAKTPQDQMAVKMEMAETMREFRKELASDPDAMDKVMSFIERNKDNAVIQKTGMLEMVQTMKERKAEMGQDKEEDIAKAEVIPRGAAKAGAVESDNPMAKDVAENVVASTKDNGKDGAIKRPDIEGGMNATEIQVNAGGPGQQRENAATAAI